MIAIIIVLFTPFAAGKLLHVGLILGYSALFLLGSFAINGKKTLSLNERDPPDALTTIKAFICTVQHIFSSFLFEVYSMSLI